MACKFITNCSQQIDWNYVLAEISNKEGTVITPNKTVLNNNEYKELFKLWDDANLNYDGVKWINYYPEDYSVDIAKKFEEVLGVTHIRSWISRIDPGCSAPWHYDIDDNEEEYCKLGKLRRFVCYVGLPENGHVSIIGNEMHYNEVPGTIYEWNNYREWHAGANVGLTPKFLYNFLSYEPRE